MSGSKASWVDPMTLLEPARRRSSAGFLRRCAARRRPLGHSKARSKPTPGQFLSPRRVFGPEARLGTPGSAHPPPVGDLSGPDGGVERVGRGPLRDRRKVSGATRTAAARWLKGCTIRRDRPDVIHNVWIRLENRSKVIERTCLVEGDRPYSPSLDGASHGAVDGGLARHLVLFRRTPQKRFWDLRKEQDGGSLFNRNTERKENRKPPEKNSGHHREPELDTATRRKGAPLPSVLEN